MDGKNSHNKKFLLTLLKLTFVIIWKLSDDKNIAQLAKRGNFVLIKVFLLTLFYEKKNGSSWDAHNEMEELLYLARAPREKSVRQGFFLRKSLK